MFEELLRMEEFSVVLEKAEEPVLIPAWLRKFRTKSKGKTEIGPFYNAKAVGLRATVSLVKLEAEQAPLIQACGQILAPVKGVIHSFVGADVCTQATLITVNRFCYGKLLSSTATGQNFEKHAVIMIGSPSKIMSGDIPYPFHQNADFLYMTGFKEPDAVMILERQQNQPFPDHNMIMFVKPRDRKREIWDGPVSGLDAAKDFFGATESYPISSLIAVIQRKYGNNTHCMWYNLADNSTNPKIHSELISLFNSDKFSYPALHSLSHNTQMLRLIKSQSEIELMKKSAEIAGKAFSRVMLSTRPGLEESVLHAMLEYECKIQGAQFLAFPPVVASGLSANTLHYVSNSHIIRNGDLILMDAGCEYNGYVSDITRTWPVSGKFTTEQRKLYEVVLKVQNHCIEHCKVGVSLDQLHQRMLLTLGAELQRIGFIDENLTDNTLKKAVAEYCPHHLGHYLGMDTHDTPSFTVAFLSSQGCFRGIGIRIEDDVLITNNGPRVLSANCPKTVEEIEQLLSLRT
eukprot:gene10949-19784_t